MSRNLFEHQNCISLDICTMRLFLYTQNALNLPRSLDIQAFFSNLHHNANTKVMEPSNPLFICILITFNQSSSAWEHSHKLCFKDSSLEEHNLHFWSSPLFYNQAPIGRYLWLHNHKNTFIFYAIFVAHNCFQNRFRKPSSNSSQVHLLERPSCSKFLHLLGNRSLRMGTDKLGEGNRTGWIRKESDRIRWEPKTWTYL